MEQTKYDKVVLPTEKIRNFDGREYQGLEIALELGDIDHAGNQYVQTKKTGDFPFEFGGRIAKAIGAYGKTVNRVIQRIGLIQYSNSWFQKRCIYSSYKEYFNEDKKRQLINSWNRSISDKKFIEASLILKVFRFNFSSSAQVSIEFDDFTIETLYEHNFIYPEEWVSEFFAPFELDRDCYDSANEAIANLKPERFATTTVAILTIPKSLENIPKLRNISGASELSPIIIDGDVVLRAVRYEDYPAVIYNIYKLGGAVFRY